MIDLLKKIAVTGMVTEPYKAAYDEELATLGIEIKRRVDKHFAGSLAIRQVDAGSCNGCELEIHALNNPFYDVERFGIHFVASPRHADVLLVTGVVSRHMQTALLRTYASMPNPKWVIAMGDCASCGGEFGTSYASCGEVSDVIAVDITVSGCPPTPLVLLKSLLTLMEKEK